MSDMLSISRPGSIVPSPRSGPISIRVATMADLAFLDGLQKLHYRQLGYFPTKQFEGYIEMGGVLVAESGRRPIGYCISRDRYLKRDELGVIFQLCVAPDVQRGLIGAALVKEVFERSAYGCKLYCCWCAQDLPANYFWESLGFVPLAFRGGSGKKKRVHIFWQKRIRAGDETTPWWFPAKTDGGAMNADRVVLPIPPGVRWSDEMPVIIRPTDAPVEAEAKRQLPAKAGGRKPLPLDAPTRHGRRQYGAPSAKPAPAPPPPVAAKPKREKKPKTKADPKLVAAARELRDRWTEEINAGRYLPEANGKYEVARQIAQPSVVSLEGSALPLLPAA